MPVTTLAEAINICDPQHPLQSDELDAYYVARPHAPFETLKTYLQVTRQNVKVLFSGHRGSGKSTELHRLAKDLDNQFFIVHAFASESLNVADLNYVDVALASVAAIFREASDRERKVKIPAQLWKEVLAMMTSDITSETTIKVPKSGSFSAKVNAYIFSLEGKYGKETETRTSMREKLYPHINDLLQQANKVCAEIEKAAQRPPLIIFEDLDKPNLKQAREVFFDHATTLNSLACRIIYTFPIALRYSVDFHERRGDYSHHFMLPNISVYTRDNQPNTDGRAALKAIVTRRVAEKMFEPNALNLLIENSGGLIRELVRLVRDAALTALTESKAVITVDAVKRVITEVANEFRHSLLPAHYEALRKAEISREIVPEEAVQQVLGNLSLLEYRNDVAWCNVHPIVRSLL